MNRLAKACAAVAFVACTPAMAADFSYHYIDAGLVLGDAAGSNDGKGPGVAISVDMPQLYQNATVFGGARYLDFDGGHLLNAEGGLGYHMPLGNVVDFNGGVALELNKYSGGGSDLGFGINAGVRARPFTPQWELDGGLKYVDIGHYSDTSVVLGTRYTFQPGISAGIELASGDIDYWTLSVRWEL